MSNAAQTGTARERLDMASALVVPAHAHDRLVVVEKPRVIGSAAKGTGFYTLRKYAMDMTPILRDCLASADRYIRDNAQMVARRILESVCEPYGEVITVPNLMITQGATHLYTCAEGSGTTTASSTSAATQGQYGYMTAITAAFGIGDGTTKSASDTDLTAATNVWYQAGGSLPGIAAGVLSASVVVTGTNAGYAWNEVIFGNFANNTGWSSTGWTASSKLNSSQGTAATANWSPNGSTHYSLYSHAAGSGLLGTKPATAATWTLNYTLTVS